MNPTKAPEVNGPENPLEKSISDAKRGLISTQQLLRLLTSSELFILSTSEVQADGRGFVPLLFDRNGTPMAAAFSSKDRANAYGSRAKFLVAMKGYELLRRVPPGYGVVLNPNTSYVLELTPDGIRNIIRDFGNPLR